MRNPSSLATWGAAVLLMSSLSGCEDLLEQYFPKPAPTPPPTVPATPPVAYALASRSLSARNNFTVLATFNPENPTSVATKPVTGLADVNRLIALDFRPATGQLYALGTDQRLYTLDVNSGAATRVSDQLPILSFSDVGFDFNPTVDRIRIVNSRDTNLRVNPTDGTVIVDTPLNPSTPPGMPGITGVAYDNNVAGATTTRLFALGGEQLYRLDSPNAGTLTPVGSVGVGLSSWDFDIGRTSNAAYALSDKQLYRIDLATGRGTRVGTLNLGALNDYRIQGFTLGL